MAVIIKKEIDSIEIEEILTEYFNSFDSELYVDSNGIIHAKIFDRLEYED